MHHPDAVHAAQPFAFAVLFVLTNASATTATTGDRHDGHDVAGTAAPPDRGRQRLFPDTVTRVLDVVHRGAGRGGRRVVLAFVRPVAANHRPRGRDRNHAAVHLRAVIIVVTVRLVADRHPSPFHPIVFRVVRVRLVHHHQLGPAAVAQRTEHAGDAAAPRPRGA